MRASAGTRRTRSLRSAGSVPPSGWAILIVTRSGVSSTMIGSCWRASGVGALRWMPPVAPDRWTGSRAAQKFGPSCAQAGRFYSPAPNDAPFGLAVRDGIGKPVGSEDCLTLNIWRPAHARQRLPVIVFIHSGSNISGYSADPIYDGAALEWLARRDRAGG